MDLLTWQRRGLLAVVGFLAFLVVAGTVVSSSQWIQQPFPGFFLYGNLTVAPDFLPDWSGNREGIRFLDRVVAVNGQKITDSKTLYDLVRQSPLRSPFRYIVERGGQELELTIPSGRFSFHDWLLSYGIYLLAGVGFLAIGFTPFYLRSSSPAAAPLFIMVSAIFFWFSTTFDFVTTQWLPKEARIFAFALTPSAGIHLGFLLTRGSRRRRGYLPYLILVYAISVGLGLAYSVTFYGRPEAWHWVLRLGYGYSCVAALVFLGLLWAELQRPASDLESRRLRVISFGALLGFFIPTFGTVLASFFSWEIPYNLLLIPAVFFPLSVAYALLKYSLFDLDLVLKVGLSRGALTGALLLVYVLLVALVAPLVGIYGQDPLVPLFFSVLVVILFNPLLRGIEAAVDRYLFRKEYDPMQLQTEAGALVKTLSRPRALAEKIVKLIAERVNIDAVLLLFRVGDGGRPLAVAVDRQGASDEDVLASLCLLWGRQFGTNKLASLCLLWGRQFGTNKKGVSRDEAETDPACRGVRAELLEVFERLKAELLISMTFEEEVVGFVALGTKRSGRGYSADDFKLFCLLADQLALALQNGALFEESERTKEQYQLLYDESQTLNKRLIEVDRQKKQFVANISHELRTPISTILGYSEVLLDASFGGDARAVLERVVTNGQELSHLMDSLFDFSRVETGSTTVDVQQVNIREMLHSLEIMAARLIKGRPIRFRIEV
ncbi:MAG: hypothetical protein HYY83_01535, partial [Deltaproteobacteria bacterium]|nr:hypothetical protein [Deltaproteobacteria bacterium]